MRSALAMVVVFLLVGAGPARADYEVGAAHRSLNPTQAELDAGAVFLGGYGVTGNPAINDRHATGILGTGPQVGAFAVADGHGGGLVIADMEVQGWFAATRDGAYGIVDMRRAAAKATGLRPDQVFIQSAHTHSGADTMGVWGGVPLAFRQRMFAETVAAITAAWKSRRAAASLVYGTADGGDLLHNQFDYDPDNQEMDTEVRVLQGRDKRGRAIASLVNFSAHPTVLGPSNTRISGDWVQAADPIIAAAIGGKVVTAVGTLGRSQPAARGCDTPGAPDEDLCRIESYARLVRDRVQIAVAGAQPVGGPTEVTSRSYLIEDASSNPFLLGLLYAGSALDAPLNRALTPPWMTGDVVGTTTGTARIGDVLVSSVPGEIYPQIARTVRDAVGAKARGFMTLGLSGDQLGYIIAPFPAAFGKPICASALAGCQDTLPTGIDPIGNDNFLFNASPTLGERVTCSLLRGADDTLGTQLRAGRSACAAFANDTALPEAADAPASGAPTPAGPTPVVARCQAVIRGTRAADHLRGGAGSERILGRGGNDRLSGGRGPDCLDGGRGDDVVVGNGGRDRMRGGPGRDRMLARGNARDVVDCGRGRDVAIVDRRDVVRHCELVRRR